MSTLSLTPPPVAAPVIAGPRPSAPPTATETARAPRPVDAVARGDPLRNPSARERPVGPPPAFDVNVLEDLRERLRDAAEPPAQPEGEGETPPPVESATPPAVHLDKKV